MFTNKPLILFDIDKTLINTEQLKVLQMASLAEHLNSDAKTIDKIRLEEYYSQLEETSDFRADEFLAFLAKKFQTSLEDLQDVFYHPKNFQAVLFPEVKEILGKLHNEGYPLGLYSEGEKKYQEHKLQTNNLLQIFAHQHRYVLARKMDKKVIANLPENTVIIDDKAAVIDFLKHFPNVIPLHLVRNAENLYGEYTLSSLSDLLPILDSLGHAGSGVK
jgi:phosphoglycolate phosphatase-like HAD superfamily hydrolase